MLRLTPYLSFRDRAREAMEFYRSVLGGELTISTFAEFQMDTHASEDDLVMHAQLETPDGLVLMASDVPSSMPYAAPAGFSVALSGPDEERLEGWWSALAEDGQVQLPLETPPWGGRFGMLTDRYGIDWMISIDA